jgi:hypothetical protein
MEESGAGSGSDPEPGDTKFYGLYGSVSGALINTDVL